MSRKTSKVGEAEQASEVAANVLVAEKAEAAVATLAAAEALAESEDAAAVAAKEAADVTAAEEVARAAEEAVAAVSHNGGKLKLSARAEEYLSVLLAQYFGTPTVAEYGIWHEAVEAGNQVLVRNGPLRLEITDVPFVVSDASTDLVGGDILLNVHRQLADVRLLD